MAKIELLTGIDKEMSYILQVLKEIWNQEPEPDHMTMRAAWDKLIDKILFYNSNDYLI